MNSKTMDYMHRSARTIAQGSLTNSKHPDRFPVNYPRFISWANGAYLFDMEGKRYIDMMSALGANHFGYGHRRIVDAMMRYSLHGGCHSLPTYHEVECAEMVKNLFCFIEKIKFVNDGSSGCTAACTIGRKYTGRYKILSEGYHGWHAEHSALVQDQPENIYNIQKLTDAMDIDTDVACVIIEPVQLDNSVERRNWLKAVRKRCDETGTVLIFDEVITGIRYPHQGVSNCYGILPDLIVLGKALSNGEKLALVGGKADLMDCEYFVSGTYHGHVPSLVAATEAMRLSKFDSKYDNDELNRLSLEFINDLNAQANGLFFVKGWGCRGAFEGDYFTFFQEMVQNGILFGPGLFVNFESVSLLPEILETSALVIDNIKTGKAKLRGRAPKSAFSAKART